MVRSSSVPILRVNTVLITEWLMAIHVGSLRTLRLALTLILLNLDIPCLCKQCRSRSFGFWRSQLIFRSQLIWICTVCHSVCEFISITKIKYSDWLKIGSGCGILIYSAWQGLTWFNYWKLGMQKGSIVGLDTHGRFSSNVLKGRHLLWFLLVPCTQVPSEKGSPYERPGLRALSVVRLTADPGVTSLNPSIGLITSVEIDLEIILWSFSPFRWFKKRTWHYWRKYMHVHKVLVHCLED